MNSQKAMTEKAVKQGKEALDQAVKTVKLTLKHMQEYAEWYDNASSLEAKAGWISNAYLYLANTVAGIKLDEMIYAKAALIVQNELNKRN